MVDPWEFGVRQGASVRERNALFNRCTIVWIARDDDLPASSGLRWVATIDTNENSPGSGFNDGFFSTRREALKCYAERCPNLRVYAQHGDDFLLKQEGNAELFPA